MQNNSQININNLANSSETKKPFYKWIFLVIAVIIVVGLVSYTAYRILTSPEEIAELPELSPSLFTNPERIIPKAPPVIKGLTGEPSETPIELKGWKIFRYRKGGYAIGYPDILSPSVDSQSISLINKSSIFSIILDKLNIAYAADEDLINLEELPLQNQIIFRENHEIYYDIVLYKDFEVDLEEFISQNLEQEFAILSQLGKEVDWKPIIIGGENGWQISYECEGSQEEPGCYMVGSGLKGYVKKGDKIYVISVIRGITIEGYSYSRSEFFDLIISTFEFIGEEEWPKEIDGFSDITSIIPVDTTGDEKLELVTSLTKFFEVGDRWYTESQIYTWDTEGKDINWYNAANRNGAMKPSIGDINGDGIKEIVAGETGKGETHLYIYNPNETVMNSWSVGQARLTVPSLSDVDNDGVNEIIVGERAVLSSESGNSVYVFNNDGSLVNGWPQETDGEGIASNIAVGDLDNDGGKEIVTFTVSGKLYVWHNNGSLMEGNWPYQIDVGTPGITGGFCSPVLVDLDNDGDLEIIIGTEMRKVYVFHHNGILADGWPQNTVGMIFDSIAIGDINNDNNPDIIVGTLLAQLSDDYRARIYAWNGQGESLSGWPVIVNTGENESSQVGFPVAIGDITGNNQPDIVAEVYFTNYIDHTSRGAVYAWNDEGILLSGWPKDIQGSSLHGSPSLADIDLDGDIEIMAGSSFYPDSIIYVWDIGSPYNSSTIHWPMSHHDPQYTGLYIKP